MTVPVVFRVDCVTRLSVINIIFRFDLSDVPRLDPIY